MKECNYCGHSNEEAMAFCAGCGKELSTQMRDSPLPELGEGEELVTLTRCPQLVDADLIKSRLGAPGIEAFIPDQFLMQNIGFNLNTYGFVRVQVRRKDLQSAEELLGSSEATSENP